MGDVIKKAFVFAPKAWTITVYAGANNDIVRSGDNGEHILIYTDDVERVPELISYAQRNYSTLSLFTPSG